jgi:hypothetical protein
MKGMAAHWYKAYKLSQPVGNWSDFINAVEEKIDARDSGQIVGNHVVEWNYLVHLRPWRLQFKVVKVTEIDPFLKLEHKMNWVCKNFMILPFCTASNLRAPWLYCMAL